MPALTTYSSITLGVNTPVQLTPPTTGGHYTLYLFNTAGGKLYISNANNPGANATSFVVPTNLYSPGISIFGAPLWIASDTAGTVSAYCASNR